MYVHQLILTGEVIVRFRSIWLRKLIASTAPLLIVATVACGQSSDQGRLTAKIDSLRQEHAIPGLAVAVMQDGSTVWARGFGVADIDEQVPVTSDTPFWIASVTKTFVGLTFLELAEEGVVDLDAPIADLPEFDEFCAWLASTELPFARELDCSAQITVRTLLTHTSNGDVGHEFLYNPLLYSRLARYVEWVINNSIEIEGGMNELARQIDARVITPAGMQRTVASQWDASKMAVVYDMARGYGVEGDSNGRQWVLRPPPKRALTAGAGIVSTVLDLAHYLAELDKGALGSAATMERLLTPPTGRDGHELPYAYGWFVQEYRGERVAWHSGWDPENGASALLLWLPERSLGFAILANGEGVHWGNPLDSATIERSEFARLLLGHFLDLGSR